MAMERKPCVTVLMPAYNAEGYIEQAIQSVIDQTFTDWQLLVIDDCSTDSTAEIVERMAQSEPRIRLLRNPENMGVARTRNRGLDLCDGSYVALLDSDDLWYPEKLSKQVALAQATGAGIVYCSYGLIDETGKKICDDFIVPEKTDFSATLITSVISCSTALLDRQALGERRFPVGFYHEDYAFWLTLLRDGLTAAGNTEVLGAYRLLSGSRASNKLCSAMNRWRVYRKHLRLPLGQSLRCWAGYALGGLRKYKHK